jgi:hypothetical protein
MDGMEVQRCIFEVYIHTTPSMKGSWIFYVQCEAVTWLQNVNIKGLIK